LKQAIQTKASCRSKDKLRHAATNHMAVIETKPERTKAFFKDPIVANAV
jgi:hypothetical protein